MTIKQKILIVDDVASNIHLFTSMLKEEFTIVAATNGLKALQIAQKTNKPDLILLDIVMPDMDGYEVCKKLKDDPSTADIPIIFVTSLNSIADQEKGLTLGGVDYITKPVSKDIVLYRIKTHLKLKNLEQKKQEIIKKKDLNMENKTDKILIVDDAPQNIQVMIEILKQDYQVSVATSGLKALEMLNSGLNPDLILLDVLMPEMDGFEVCQNIKKNINFKDIPVMFVTILEDEQDIVKGLNLGAVDYVVKPIEPTILKARVKTHLNLKHFQDKLMQNLKEKENMLLTQSKMASMGEMLEAIAHQWRQPLSVITTSASGMKLQKEFGTLSDDLFNQSCDLIGNSAQHLSQTIDDFRGFLKQDKIKKVFNLENTFKNTFNLIKSKFKNKGIDIIENIHPVQINGLEQELMQVFINILNNARDELEKKDYTKVIFVNIYNKNKNTIIQIKDNAGGIPKEILPNIFDAYFSTKHDSDGTGIGLYISKKIVEDSFNGTIEAKNEAYEYNDNNYKGAIFEIIL